MKSERPLLDLPLDHAWPEIERALKAHRNLVLVAEPGAGKSTRFPPGLLRSGFVPKGKKIIMLEPRRLAARASACRIADEQGWKLGEEVGYQVRFENVVSAETAIEVITEGLLTRRLRTDPELSNVGAVILDEFHERSLHTDLALGLLYEMQQLNRPDLRIIVMSATLDAERVAGYMGGSPIVRVPGKLHPVQIHYGKKPLSIETGTKFHDMVAGVIIDVMDGSHGRSGDVLVFLPGAREIRAVRERIGRKCVEGHFTCYELHGGLTLEEQDRAIRRDPERGKIVLATNIAETSLTIDGVGTVIDTGLARISRLDQAGFERLQLSRISQASATQRAGRAGRQGPGVCYRLWNKNDEASMAPFENPEILRSDLCDVLMTLLAQGVTDPTAFSWFERPSLESIGFATRTLIDLGLCDEKGVLTPDGRESLKLPVAPRLARLVLEAAKVGAKTLGSRLAALLSEKDILLRGSDFRNEVKRQAHQESDLLLRLHLWEQRSPAIDRAAVRSVERLAAALESTAGRLALSRAGPPPPTILKGFLSSDDLARCLLLLAYPDRLCRRRRPKDPQARMVGGRGVTLSPHSTVETAELFVALASSEPGPATATSAKLDAQIGMASAVDRVWVENLFPHSISKKSQVVFDEDSESVLAQTAVSFRDLPLVEPSPARPTPDEAHALLVSAALERWQTRFLSHHALAHLIDRLRFLGESMPDRLIAAGGFDIEGVKRAAIEEVCFGETRLGDVLARPVDEAFYRQLSKGVQKLLEEAPESLKVPSGSRMKIGYPEARPPFVEVRIQEIFGLKTSPKVAFGQVPVTFHLLGPNFRPVQVTADLESFWKNGYLDVRKELRSRYPKHSWPEDPMTAKPEAKGKRKS